MIFTGYDIDTPVDVDCINQESQNNAANNVVYGDGVRFCSYMKSVAGKKQIFVGVSRDEGETWDIEQVTSSAYDHYESSCAIDVPGTGLHLVYAAKGYGSTEIRRANTSIIYNYRYPDGSWRGEWTIIGGGPVHYADAWHPCIAIDSSDNVHLACIWGINYSSYFGYTLPAGTYRRFNAAGGVVSGVGDRHEFRYGYHATQCMLNKPNIQVDSYGNPQITYIIKKPRADFGANCFTSVWIANFQQGHIDGWPGTRYPGIPTYCVGYLNDAPNAHVLCDKDKRTGVGTVPNYPSYYARMALSHNYDEGAYDYPHCVFSFVGYGIYPGGTYYTWKDGTGWHDEVIALNSPPDSPSIAIGADGVLHSVVEDVIGASFGYRQKASPAEAWSAKTVISSVNYPRQLSQLLYAPFPLTGAPCSPFMAVEGTTLKYFKCESFSRGYGYFM